MPTSQAVTHDYPRYLPLMNEAFGRCDLAGIINWHEGGNAPDPIFCVHTTGDVRCGIFGAADPVLTTAAVLCWSDPVPRPDSTAGQRFPRRPTSQALSMGPSPRSSHATLYL